MLILVIALFLICWGSRLSMEISIKVGLNTFSHEMYILRVAINLLPYVHSCLNPFIYSLMSKNFRRSMWRRWKCCCCLCNGSKFSWSQTARHHRRHCFCHSAASSSTTDCYGDTVGNGAITATLGATDLATQALPKKSPVGHRQQCRHCCKFGSHYSLKEISGGKELGHHEEIVTSEISEINGSLRENGLTITGSAFRMPNFTKKATRVSTAASSSRNPLLRRLQGHHDASYSTSVMMHNNAGKNSEVDCCL